MTEYIVTFGKSRCVFFTPYHCDQFARALALNGTPFRITIK